MPCHAATGENTVFKHTAPPSRLSHESWWQPGVYASGPAVFLWIVARLPGDLLADIFSTRAAPAVLNHVGDTLFVAGWLASAAWLWFTRKRPDPKVDRDKPASAEAESAARARRRAG
jgi:hypothetical protein